MNRIKLRNTSAAPLSAVRPQHRHSPGWAIGVAFALLAGTLAGCGSDAATDDSTAATSAASPAGQAGTTPGESASAASPSAQAGGSTGSENPAGTASGGETGVNQALHDALPDEYQTNGVEVAFYNDWAPDEFLDEKGELAGWSVDLAKAMSTRLGVEFRYTGTSFEAILPAIQNKRFDAGFASFAPVPDRLKVLDFIPERVDPGGYAYLSKNDLSLNAPADFCGHSVAVLTGAYDYQVLDGFSKDDCVAKGAAPIDIQQFPQQAAAELAMSSGRVEIVAAGSGKLAYLAKQKGDITLADYKHQVLPDNLVSIGVRKGDPLGQVLTDTLQSLIDDGTYLKVMSEWGFGDQPELLLTKAMLVTEANPEPPEMSAVKAGGK